MILEMHCHTAEHSSCSRISAAELVQRNFEKGLQGTVLTDHHYFWPPWEIEALRRKLKVPDHYMILSGQEVTTPELGDILVYGADSSIEKGTSLPDICARFPGAALVWAHPYRNENIPPRDKLFHPLINGIEIFNSNHSIAESARGLRDWHRYKFTAIAGTDTHALSYAGTYPTSFDHPVSTIEELAAEIRAGRCRPFFREIPRSGTTDTRVTELMLGTKGRGLERERYIIKAHNSIMSWSSATRTLHIMEGLARHGFQTERFRIPKPLGYDRDGLTAIEQGIQGETLYDKLLYAAPGEATLYLRMTAEWLARLHNMKLQITPPDEFIRDEPLRLERYISAFHKMNSAHTRRAEEIMNTVLETEASLFCRHPERMVQGHGDFHPKNILIGRDNADDSPSLFVAAIDFDSSYALPPSFDVGTFLAQIRNQFYDEEQAGPKAFENIFLQTYLQEARNAESDFLPLVELFRARTSLSISYYLIKVGLGTSENLRRVLIEAEHGLAGLAVKAQDRLFAEHSGNRRDRTG